MFLFISIVTLLANAASSSGEQAIACEATVLNLSCPPGQHIVINAANYGRTSLSICPSIHVGTIHCTSGNTKTILESNCNNKKNCTVNVQNSIFGNPCFGTYKYIEVSYSCVPTINTNITCEGKQISLSCPIATQTINIVSANYGRLDSTTCTSISNSNTNCASSTSVSVVQQKCQGLNSCILQASNSDFGDPCPGVSKYLTVSYSCENPTPAYFEYKACQGTVLNLECQGTKKMKILDAAYGRDDAFTCQLPGSLLNTNCNATTSYRVVFQACNNKPSCSVISSDFAFGDPCPFVYKFLYVKYTCV